jgi:hypothetical protein
LPYIQNMAAGVKIKDVVVGEGAKASKKSHVVIHVRGFLKRGDMVVDTHKDGQPWRIDLGKRDCFAGLRYGVEGMCVGGRRELVISPHLGYGAQGVPGKIPPNAVLRLEVELLEVREAGVVKPEVYPLGKHLYFFWPGEASRGWPRVQFGLEEDGHCGAGLTMPQPGLTWRHARNRAIEDHLGKADCNALFDEVLSLPQKHPKACLPQDMLWADSSEKANSVTRDSLTNTPCVTIGISDHGVWQCYYSMRETDPVLLQSNLYGLVKKLVAKIFPPDDGK